jgi:hypothetical protein
MAEKKTEKTTRMIHIRLPADVHRLMRIRVAEEDTKVQDWVAALIEKTVKGRKKK